MDFPVEMFILHLHVEFSDKGKGHPVDRTQTYLMLRLGVYIIITRLERLKIQKGKP